ncbi:hotdog fold thioesterase [Falsiroseomonas ponticola]|jgi:1,4-dihydroxy-2-naphthoyl-CoA hydrolase|uniref:hotdog fold thioesterase n=1 Tax=Falsiroseomonas ponticola TaxID=2786951 RepID=UPI001932CF28|nr:hotdog fold thioesterase [Roseomonas ponticola]
MALWKRDWTPDQINERSADSMAGQLGIRITRITEDALHAEMPVDHRTAQPFGLLHGGASVVLSETLGSLASIMTLPEGQIAVGLEVNANHLAGVKRGETVTAICRPLHTGRRTQVWQTEIRRADGKLACVSRLTTAVVEGNVA